MADPDELVVRVAAVQLESQANVSANLAECAARVEQARASGAELVVLPENFAVFGGDDARCAAAEHVARHTGPIVSALRELARKHSVAIVAGGMPEASDDPMRPYNASVCIRPDGSVAGVYHKIHLFDVDLPGDHYAESARTRAGAAPLVVELCGLRVGVSICYDLRFPALYQSLVDANARVLTVTAAFTEQTGKAHWHVLVRARAIETQCWVIAAAQWGSHPGGRRTYGHSMIVSPWGEIVAERAEGAGVICADVDMARLAECRQRLPSWRHHRL